MELTAEELKAAAQEIRNAIEDLRSASNEAKVLHDVLTPTIFSQLEAIRGHRMAIGREVSDMMIQLRTVQDYIADSRSRKDADTLRELLALCSDLLRFKENGILDVLLDVAVRWRS